MQIQAALDLFLVQLVADGRSSHTQRQYRRHVRLFATWARTHGPGDVVETLEHGDVAAFLASETGRLTATGTQRKATSANALRTSLRCFLSYCHEAGLVASNPARLVRRARCGPPPPRALSEEELERLLGVMESDTSPEARRDYLLFTLMARTGVRLSEALALQVEDIDLDRGELWLRDTKGNRPRVQGVLPEVAALLGSLMGDGMGDVFQATSGRRLGVRQVQRRFAGWCERAGVRGASPHALRHTFATGLYRSTRDLLLVRDTLGHRSIVSTTVYLSGQNRA